MDRLSEVPALNPAASPTHLRKLRHLHIPPPPGGGEVTGLCYRHGEGFCSVAVTLDAPVFEVYPTADCLLPWPRSPAQLFGNPEGQFPTTPGPDTQQGPHSLISSYSSPSWQGDQALAVGAQKPGQPPLAARSSLIACHPSLVAARLPLHRRERAGTSAQLPQQSFQPSAAAQPSFSTRIFGEVHFPLLFPLIPTGAVT